MHWQSQWHPAGCFESFYTDSWCVAATKFLIKCGADVNERPRFGYDFTPLARAVHRHNVEAIKLLLAAGADPQAPILGGTSTILDWLRGRIEKTRDESEKAILVELLGLLSDE